MSYTRSSEIYTYCPNDATIQVRLADDYFLVLRTCAGFVSAQFLPDDIKYACLRPLMK